MDASELSRTAVGFGARQLFRPKGKEQVTSGAREIELDAARLPHDGQARVARRKLFGEQQRFMLLLIAPSALLLLLFQVVPIVMGANASFRDWALSNPKKTWIGLDHYAT